MRRIRPDWYGESASPAPAAPRYPSSSGTSRAPTVAARPALLSSCILAPLTAPASSSVRPATFTAAPQPTPFTTRADAPVVRHVTRGSSALAIELLQKRGLESLTDDLRHDKVARTSVGPSASTWKTWQGFHVEAFGSGTPTLPVTPDSIVAVGSLFKCGGFRSFANYATAAKNAHVEAGHVWTQLHEHTRVWVSRSVSRGIGPARQSCSFTYRRLLLLPMTPEPLTNDGPQHPVRFTQLATSFLLREIEASTTVCGSWSFDDEAKEFTWLLPGSKSDHLALGVSRIWPCICGVRTLACPYHLGKAHLEWLEASEHPTCPRAPIFPTKAGGHPSKIAAVATFEAIGTLCGQPLKDAEGHTLFGGHSARVTGSQTLAIHGLEVQKIRILARHGGDTILRYVAGALLRLSARTSASHPPAHHRPVHSVPLHRPLALQPCGAA